MKLARVILISVLLIGFVGIAEASTLPTVGGNNNQWGTILNEFLGVSLDGDGNITASKINTTHILDNTILGADISDTTNITFGEKINFTYGEIIDNIYDGIIQVTGQLNVTGDIIAGDNVTADYLLGNGQYLTGIAAGGDTYYGAGANDSYLYNDSDEIFLNEPVLNTTIGIFNTSMLAWVDGQNTIYNNTLKAYLDGQDAVYNTSMTTYVDGTFLKQDDSNNLSAVTTDIKPANDDANNLGSSTKQWKDIWSDGSINSDRLVLAGDMLMSGDILITSGKKIQRNGGAGDYFLIGTNEISMFGNGNGILFNVTGGFVTGDLFLYDNLTTQDKITFNQGEIIDNIYDGIIQVTGQLNVTTDVLARNVTLSDAALADKYFSGDGSQGATNTTGIWTCTNAGCTSFCQLLVKDGLIVGCT